MVNQQEELEWNRLGTGDLLLIAWNRLVSVVIGVIVILVLWNIDKLPISIDELLIDSGFIKYVPLIASGFKWLVVLYFAGELVILIWDLLLHFSIRYRLQPDCVVKKGGVYRTYTHTIPGNRVQGVEVFASPTQRIVGVSTVSITTAGVHSPNMTIHNLKTSEAQAIQNRLGVDHD